jgi:hypothetical protein
MRLLRNIMTSGLAKQIGRSNGYTYIPQVDDYFLVCIAQADY